MSKKHTPVKSRPAKTVRLPFQSSPGKNGILFAACLLLFSSCEMDVPVREFSAARRAIIEAREAGAPRFAEREYSMARRLLLQAHTDIVKEDNRELAEQHAQKALQYARSAYRIAVDRALRHFRASALSIKKKADALCIDEIDSTLSRKAKLLFSRGKQSETSDPVGASRYYKKSAAAFKGYTDTEALIRDSLRKAFDDQNRMFNNIFRLYPSKNGDRGKRKQMIELSSAQFNRLLKERHICKAVTIVRKRHEALYRTEKKHVSRLLKRLNNKTSKRLMSMNESMRNIINTIQFTPDGSFSSRLEALEKQISECNAHYLTADTTAREREYGFGIQQFRYLDKKLDAMEPEFNSLTKEYRLLAARHRKEVEAAARKKKEEQKIAARKKQATQKKKAREDFKKTFLMSVEFPPGKHYLPSRTWLAIREKLLGRSPDLSKEVIVDMKCIASRKKGLAARRARYIRDLLLILGCKVNRVTIYCHGGNNLKEYMDGKGALKDRAVIRVR